jgi:FMN phosphatase YigB (HAD superfamily)
MKIRAVIFDVGETLIDETRQWSRWAERLGIPKFTFFATFGALIERNEHHRKIFDTFGFDYSDLTTVRNGNDDGQGHIIEAGDFYPDSLSTLAALKASDFIIGIAGNQPESAEMALLSCGVDVDFIASSARWGVEKPSPAFFELAIQASGCHPSEIAYVGDRIDNDISPALAAGMRPIFLLRGPWAFIHADRLDANKFPSKIRSLAELPTLLSELT